MSKAEKTRNYIIEKAAPVFNTKGYAGTSLTDLIEATRLTKGAIYGNFENKDEIAIAVYKYNVTLIGKRLDDAMNAKKSATDKLIAFTEYYRTNWKKICERGGCPILNASVEADDNLPVLKKNVQYSVKKLASKITEVIDDGKKKHEFKKKVNSTDFAYTIIAQLEGGMMLTKIMDDAKYLFSALDQIVKMVHQESKK